MGFRSGAYSKIWSIEKGKGNYYVADMSTSKKMKDRNGNEIQENGKTKYETDWSNKFVRLVGTAAKQAESLKSGDSVKIESCEVTSKYDKEKGKEFVNYVIFAFDNSQNNSSNSVPTGGNGFMNIPDGVEDEGLPFN
ncbi:hypothetical protein [Clostridium sp. HBUAS56010]|uniref:hypothetical protein n=1 Tax=Clostridium sp. HBUAS56010 TaxID=2571127 RepID=UPI0011788E9B|nr:hypothetical protein [Clostridium sp. HBUAS56010]